MLKIAFVETSNGTPTLSMEGRLIGPWVEELRRLCDSILAGGGKLILDLSEVSFVDRNGVELLQSLRQRHVVLVNYSNFVAELLRA